MALVAQGWTFAEIGSHLGIAPRIVLLYLVHLQRCHGAQTPGALTQVLLQGRSLPLEWARAQKRRPRPRKPRPATAAPAPAGPPPGDAGGDTQA